MMELRKVCNHPFLLQGSEEQITAGQSEEEASTSLVRSSSKMIVRLRDSPSLLYDRSDLSAVPGQALAETERRGPQGFDIQPGSVRTSLCLAL